MSTPNSQSQKTLIILVHGGASSSHSYNTVISHLKSPPTNNANNPPLEIHAIDLPGHGTNATVQFTFTSAIEHLATQILTHTQTTPLGPPRPKVLVVGISLGGQVVLALLRYNPSIVDAAIVSGVSIRPPDDKVSWEMPHMPSDQATVDMMMEDVRVAGFERMGTLQEASLGFTFKPSKLDTVSAGNGSGSESVTKPTQARTDPKWFPPVLVVIGEHDMAMQRRDFDELVGICRAENEGSDGLVMKGAWHNHNIDVPEQFAAVIREWISKVFE